MRLRNERPETPARDALLQKIGALRDAFEKCADDDTSERAKLWAVLRPLGEEIDAFLLAKS
jgi:hypothetical protein